MNDQQVEVYRAHRDAQIRYTYFLLAAAGAGIALAVNDTRGGVLSTSQIPLACAVASWGFSFFAGCRHLGYGMSVLRTNLGLLQVQAGIHPVTGANLEAIAIGTVAMKEIIERDNETANRYGIWQFRLLVLGGLAYVAWHIFEMYLRRSSGVFV